MSQEPPETSYAETAYAETPNSGEHFNRMDARWIIVQRIDNAIGWIVIAIGYLVGITLLAIFQSITSPFCYLPAALGSLALLALWWTGYVLPARRYEVSGWRFDDRGLAIRLGLWWRRELTIPKARVQHTDVSQGPLLRRYGLANLMIHTAGTTDATIALPGLAYETACTLRDQLIQDSQQGKQDVV